MPEIIELPSTINPTSPVVRKYSEFSGQNSRIDAVGSPGWAVLAVSDDVVPTLGLVVRR